MDYEARKITLPEYTVTELCDERETGAQRISLPNGVVYFVRPRLTCGESLQGEDKRIPTTFYTFPLVVNRDGSPWDEANLFIFKTVEEAYAPNMTTFSGVADDLAAYRRFLDKSNIDWENFPAHKLARPTYRYKAHLINEVSKGSLKLSTASRRIRVVIRFYTWLIHNQWFSPAHPPWRVEEKMLSIASESGQPKLLKINSTDLRLRFPKQEDPFADTIIDGGKLRPLPKIQQEWLLEALQSLGNTEMTLIHMFALVTGARIQTILTFRVSDVIKDSPAVDRVVYPVGPGTGIDTKNDKKQVLHIPKWFYNQLRIYAMSERARKRRCAAFGGDAPDQYLFLSVRGSPMYVSKHDRSYSKEKLLRHNKVGQAVRQYMTDYIIPWIRRKYDSAFHYQFHDTRATFGMNLVDEQRPRMDRGEITYTQVLSFVGAMMSQDSVVVTERYLQFPDKQILARRIQDGWEAKLQKLAGQAVERLNDEL